MLGVRQELGAFRSIRTYRLRRRPDGTSGPAASPRQAPRSAATASDPTGRTVTMLLTDGVGPCRHRTDARAAGYGSGLAAAPLRYSRRCLSICGRKQHVHRSKATSAAPG